MRIQKILALSAAFFAAAGLMALVSCSKKASGGLTINQGKLTIGMEISYPPMEYFEDDGKTPTGFDVDMARALGRELGLEVVFENAEFAGLFGGIKVDKFDALISAVTITPERVEEFTFTKPYIGNAMTIVIRRDAQFLIAKPEDIAGYRVSYQEGTTAEIYADKILAAGHAFEAFKYPSVMNCFDDLKNGRVDIIVVDSLVALEYLEREPESYTISYQGKAEEYFGICLKKGNSELESKLNSALDKLLSSGELTSISQKYFKMDLVSGIN